MIPSHDDLASKTKSLLMGPAVRLGMLIGLRSPGGPPRGFAALRWLWLLTWVPVAILTAIAGHAFPGRVDVPWFHDLEANGRLLFALPLFELAAGIVGPSLATQVRSFLRMDLVPAHQHANFHAAHAATARSWESRMADAALMILAYAVTLWLRRGLGYDAGPSSWERVGTEVTLAGWWHMLVSLPILNYFVLRWIWIYGAWAVFLFRVSRLDLKLSATHPDKVGGLGFLAWGVGGFSPVMTAMSAMISSGLATAIYHRGTVLADLKYDIGGFVVVAIAILYLPLISFVGPLARCRFNGLLNLGKLVLDHDRAFEEKWLEGGQNLGNDILGSADFQSLAGTGACYDHVNDMWLFPFDIKAFAVIALSALLPFVALLGNSIKELLLKLGELLI